MIYPLPTLPASFKLFSIILILMCSFTLVFCFQNVPWCYCDQCPVLSGTSPVWPLKISHLGETLLSTRQITVKSLLNGMEQKKSEYFSLGYICYTHTHTHTIMLSYYSILFLHWIYKNYYWLNCTNNSLLFAFPTRT